MEKQWDKNGKKKIQKIAKEKNAQLKFDVR